VQDYYVKPMNCPFHIQCYQFEKRSYRDLPIRYAELGTVYRYEKDGVRHGLFRVRGFTQDDAHIFCTPEQIVQEIKDTVEFAKKMLGKFGFHEIQAYLSTKPAKAVGDPARWEQATERARVVLDEDAEEALDGAEERAVDHVGLVLLAVRPHVGEVEALGQVEVELDGSELPGAPEGVLDLHVDLRAVERAAALVDLPSTVENKLCMLTKKNAHAGNFHTNQ